MVFLSRKKCIPCDYRTIPLPMDKINQYLKQLDGWILSNNIIEKEYLFSDYVTGLNFAYDLGKIAEAEGHHPEIIISWKRIRVILTTYIINALSKNDFVLASKFDENYLNTLK